MDELLNNIVKNLCHYVSLPDNIIELKIHSYICGYTKLIDINKNIYTVYDNPLEKESFIIISDEQLNSGEYIVIDYYTIVYDFSNNGITCTKDMDFIDRYKTLSSSNVKGYDIQDLISKIARSSITSSANTH